MEIDIEQLREALAEKRTQDHWHIVENAAQYLLDNADLLLVKLPEGWVHGNMFYAQGGLYVCDIWHLSGDEFMKYDDNVQGEGPTPRQASMAALAKIGEANV